MLPSFASGSLWKGLAAAGWWPAEWDWERGEERSVGFRSQFGGTAQIHEFIARRLGALFGAETSSKSAVWGRRNRSEHPADGGPLADASGEVYFC